MAPNRFAKGFGGLMQAQYNEQQPKNLPSHKHERLGEPDRRLRQDH
jgi:hypothetical protein